MHILKVLWTQIHMLNLFIDIHVLLIDIRGLAGWVETRTAGGKVTGTVPHHASLEARAISQ